MRDYVATQNDFIDKLQAACREWFDYAHSETKLTSEFMSNLMDGRTFPEVMAVYQRFADHHFSTMMAHGAHLFECTQRVMEAEADILLDGGTRPKSRSPQRKIRDQK